MVVDLPASFWIFTWNKLIKAKAICPLTFFLKNLFQYENLLQKQPLELLSKKRQSLKLLEYAQENVLQSLFNKAAGLHDFCKTYLLYSHLRFYFSFGKTLKKFMNFP